MAQSKSRFAKAYEAQETAEQLSAKRRMDFGRCETRRSIRVDHAEPVELLTGRGIASASMENLSVTGASVKPYEGEEPAIFDIVSVRLCDGRHIHGRVVRADKGVLGVKFADDLTSLDEIVHFEGRGETYYRAAIRHSSRKGRLGVRTDVSRAGVGS